MVNAAIILGVGGGLQARCRFPLPFPEKLMKIQFHIVGLNVSAGLRRWLEGSLGKLEALISITGVAVVLEHPRGAAPGFRASVHLTVPGPDFHAKASDYTVQAAILKVVKNLKKQIRARQSRRADKRNTNVQLGLLPGHAPMGLATLRA